MALIWSEYCSDGWTDPARHPLINFMVSSQNGLMFLKPVDALGKYKDAHFMGELFIKIIEVGVDYCVQIITDNAPVCKAASMIVETKYPQVFSIWTSASHVPVPKPHVSLELVSPIGTYDHFPKVTCYRIFQNSEVVWTATCHCFIF